LTDLPGVGVEGEITNLVRSFDFGRHLEDIIPLLSLGAGVWNIIDRHEGGDLGVDVDDGAVSPPQPRYLGT